LSNSKNADALIASLIQREGGFVNHPSDRGGATKYGITIGTLRDWRRKPVGVPDVQNLSVEEATDIYRNRYFTASGFDQIKDPEFLELMFDFAVMSGVGGATKGLQNAINAIPGFDCGAADGVMGPRTLAAMLNAEHRNAEALFYRVKCERYEALLRFIGADHNQADFAAGWANRLDKLQDK
jgi:lysozyme family protein